MHDDAELLRRYVEDRSEAAFTELVRHHIALVYAAALRRVGGDAHLAQDVAQQVFTALAQKASTLRTRATLGGWLYVSTHVAAAAVVRREQRRKNRESAAHTMQTLSATDDAPNLDPLRPALDDALVALKNDEREAIVLRFFQQRSFADVGAALQVSDDAARKRVDRALEKLRARLARRGITSTTAALTLALAASAAVSVPGMLTTQVAGQALAHAPLGSGTILTTTLATLKSAWPIAAAITIGAALVLQHRANHDLRAELQTLNAIDRQVAGLREENRALARLIAQAEEQAVARPQAASVRVMPTAIAASAFSAPASSGGGSTIMAGALHAVALKADGTIAWDDNAVTLNQFLARLKELETTGGAEGSALVIRAADKTAFDALDYVLDEARKAGITRVMVQSSASPHARSRWFQPVP